jgi:hypothetical protein
MASNEIKVRDMIVGDSYYVKKNGESVILPLIAKSDPETGYTRAGGNAEPFFRLTFDDNTLEHLMITGDALERYEQYIKVDTNRGGKRKYRRSRKSKKSRKSKSRKSKSRKGKSRKSNRRR